MTQTYEYEYTDTFAGEANYCWVRRGKVTMPELTHYGYDGSTNYSRANRIESRELMRRVKAELGLSGVRGKTYHHGRSHACARPTHGRYPPAHRPRARVITFNV